MGRCGLDTSCSKWGQVVMLVNRKLLSVVKGGEFCSYSRRTLLHGVMDKLGYTA